jgi:hypothetical protein
MLAAADGSAQESVTVARCATPSGGLESGPACDSLAAPLPVAIAFRTSADSIPLARADVEAVFLDALARALRRPVRADSAWGVSRRGPPPRGAGVAAPPPRALEATMLYWLGQPDRTLDLVCQSHATLDLPFGSTPALTGVLAADVRAFGRCAEARGEAGPTQPVEPPPATPLKPFLFVVLPLALALLVSGLIWWFLLRRRPPDFWQLAARYPDKAYDWFTDHDDWVVVDPDEGKVAVPNEREFEGPFLFWVPRLGGRRVAVYGRRTAMSESQRAFLSVHGLDSEGIDRS